MSEYIVDGAEPNSTVLKSTTPNGYEHEKWLPVREEIVRCRDCVNYQPYRTHQHGMMNRCHDEHGHTHKRDENDFCSRGEKASNFTTCKCGEDIEISGRESVSCPSCGKVVSA